MVHTSGIYNWTIPAGSLSAGSYTLILNFGEEDYQNATWTFYLRVVDLPTIAANIFDITQPALNSSTLAEPVAHEFEIYLAYNLIVNASYFDDNNTDVGSCYYNVVDLCSDDDDGWDYFTDACYDEGTVIGDQCFYDEDCGYFGSPNSCKIGDTHPACSFPW